MNEPNVESSLRTRTAAHENWRRLRQLWMWCGRREDQGRLLRVLRRYAPGAPLIALERARLGHHQGAGRLRRRSAEAIVAPLLGVGFPGHEACALRAHEYRGPAPANLCAYLRALDEHAHWELAEHWVDYLRRERDDEPGQWTPPPELDIARESPRSGASARLEVLERRLARIELLSQRLWLAASGASHGLNLEGLDVSDLWGACSVE